MQFQKAKCAAKSAKATKYKQNAIANAECSAATGLILDKEKVVGLKGVALKDQLKAYQAAGAPNLIRPPQWVKSGRDFQRLWTPMMPKKMGHWRRPRE